jgi:type I restriction enzyme S subunit
MASEWQLTAFGALLAEPVRNGVYKPKEYHGRGAKIVNMGELFAHPRLRALPMKRVELSDSESDRFTLAKGDLLFARRSLVAEGAGKCSVVLDVDEPTTFESSIIRARPDRTKVNSLFLYYFFNSTVGLHCLDTIRRQVAVAGITGSDLSRLEVQVPPLPEQRAIAHILGTLEDKIELNRRMGATLEAMARALFKAWFVDFEPVRAKAEGRDPGLPPHLAALFPDRLVDSEMGQIPDGWEVGPLDSVLVLQRGFDLPTQKRTPGSFPVLAASGPSGTHETFMVRGPGVTTGRSGILGKVFYVDGDFWPLNTSLWVKEFKQSSPAYAFHLLRGIDLTAFNAGSAVPTLNRNHIHNLPTLQPPTELIDAFERFAAAGLKFRGTTEKEVSTLAALRDTLLPKLISGDLRVKDAETFLDRVL